MDLVIPCLFLHFSLCCLTEYMYDGSACGDITDLQETIAKSGVLLRCKVGTLVTHSNIDLWFIKYKSMDSTYNLSILSIIC